MENDLRVHSELIQTNQLPSDCMFQNHEPYLFYLLIDTPKNRFALQKSLDIQKFPDVLLMLIYDSLEVSHFIKYRNGIFKWTN
jgi:hypothetical protein